MNGGFWLPTVFYKFELQEENIQILSMQILPWIQFYQVHPKIEGIYNFSKKNSVKSLPKKAGPRPPQSVPVEGSTISVLKK